MKLFKPVLRGVKKPFKLLKIYLKQKAGWLGTPKILAYRGFGNDKHVYIKGMVIEDKGLTKPVDKQRVWANILATIKRFSSDQIPGVRVEAKFLGMTAIAKTDELGFFSFYFDVKETASSILEKNWHKVEFVLLDDIVENQPVVTATGEVRIVPPTEKRIIVSDIDDTVLVSHSTTTIPKLRLMLFKNALMRVPFKGVASFYCALERGAEKDAFHPIFYVSSSEWNLYDLLENFFDHNRIPKGVFMLRKLEHSIYKFWKSGQGSHEHKYDKIKFLFQLFDKQKFILIGDSGQKDPGIYLRLAHDFPGRIESIYIRKIGKGTYQQTLENFNKKLQQTNTSYLQVEDTSDAAKHALGKGYIHEDALTEHLCHTDDESMKI
ncbi:MAG: phosphatase domain-containing protein [Bacteroidales bacterium]